MSSSRIVRRTLPEASSRLPDELHPVLHRLYLARGVNSADELETGLSHLLPVQRLGNTRAAAWLLHQVMAANGHILIVADYDTDGATSCALAVRALRSMGAARVSYLVPNRFDYGYGLTPEIVDLAAEQSPDLIVTVDNGIASLAGVAHANELNIPVLVTDHHLPGAELPEAAVIVNPNLPDDPFPSKHLAGVGVIFYVMLALRSNLREVGWFSAHNLNEPKLAELLDLVALGTVADVVQLDHNNRILVEQGLRRIRAGACCPGIAALIRQAKRTASRLVTSDLGFAIAPRLNAAGRLDDMSLGVMGLISDSTEQAARIAEQLDRLNGERREIEQAMQQQAEALLGGFSLSESDELPLGLCLYRPEWHQGVIGILASRLKEAYHRPVIVFADAGDGSLKGSARSVPGLHIRDALDAIATTHPEMLQKFGGHAMAAGLSLHQADLDPFRQAFEREVGRHLTAGQLVGVIDSDGELTADEMSLELAQLLRTAAPWGQGFPEPQFDGCFRVVQQRIVGDRHLKMVLSPRGDSRRIDAIAFNQAAGETCTGDEIHAAYRLDVNEFRGSISPQLIVEYFSSTN